MLKIGDIVDRLGFGVQVRLHNWIAFVVQLTSGIGGVELCNELLVWEARVGKENLNIKEILKYE